MLAAHGAKVTIFNMNEPAGATYAAKIAGRFALVNVADEAQVADAVAQAEVAHGVARILVSCAGVAIGLKTVGRESQPHPLAEFRRVIDVNLVGTFNVIAQFAAALSRAEALGDKRGVVINTASVAAYEGQVGQAAYAASKAGIVGLTLPVARDLAQFGIRAITIAPGIFWTPMMAGMAQAVQDSLGKQDTVPKPPRQA